MNEIIIHGGGGLDGTRDDVLRYLRQTFGDAETFRRRAGATALAGEIVFRIRDFASLRGLPVHLADTVEPAILGIAIGLRRLAAEGLIRSRETPDEIIVTWVQPEQAPEAAHAHPGRPPTQSRHERTLRYLAAWERAPGADQKTVAVLMGIGQSTLSRWLRTPEGKAAERIAHADSEDRRRRLLDLKRPIHNSQ